MLCWNICMRYPWNQLVTLILTCMLEGFNSPIWRTFTGSGHILGRDAGGLIGGEQWCLEKRVRSGLGVYIWNPTRKSIMFIRILWPGNTLYHIYIPFYHYLRTHAYKYVLKCIYIFRYNIYTFTYKNNHKYVFQEKLSLWILHVVSGPMSMGEWVG